MTSYSKSEQTLLNIIKLIKDNNYKFDDDKLQKTLKRIEKNLIKENTELDITKKTRGPAPVYTKQELKERQRQKAKEYYDNHKDDEEWKEKERIRHRNRRSLLKITNN
jgi:mitochondrial fission protein ELM1